MKEINEIEVYFNPVVSICMITYNHGQYITEAIEGILLQKTSFTFELVIGVDNSKDNTIDICLKYQKKHPDKIRLLLNDENIGMMPNLIQTLKSCRGKYIATCEGDDYWTDPLKLQKQVNFLETNPDYSICAHRVSIVEDNMLQKLSNYTSTCEGLYTIEDLAKGNLISTPSVIFRNGLIKQFPSWFEMSPVGDYVLHMLNAKKGKIKYLNETMATYRKHPGGIWSAQPRHNLLEKWIRVLSYLLREEFDEKVLELLKIQKRNTASDYLKLILESNPALFKAKLEELTDEDPELGKEWLLNHFPTHIFELKKSNTFKLAQKISKLASLIKKLIIKI